MNEDIKKLKEKLNKKLENYELDKVFGQLSVDSIYSLFPNETKMLLDYINQLETNRDEAIDYIEEHSGMISRFTTIKSEYAQEELNVEQLDNLLEILKRGKE